MTAPQHQRQCDPLRHISLPDRIVLRRETYFLAPNTAKADNNGTARSRPRDKYLDNRHIASPILAWHFRACPGITHRGEGNAPYSDLGWGIVEQDPGPA